MYIGGVMKKYIFLITFLLSSSSLLEAMECEKEGNSKFPSKTKKPGTIETIADKEDMGLEAWLNSNFPTDEANSKSETDEKKVKSREELKKTVYDWLSLFQQKEQQEEPKQRRRAHSSFNEFAASTPQMTVTEKFEKYYVALLCEIEKNKDIFDKAPKKEIEKYHKILLDENGTIMGEVARYEHFLEITAIGQIRRALSDSSTSSSQKKRRFSRTSSATGLLAKVLHDSKNTNGTSSGEKNDTN